MQQSSYNQRPYSSQTTSGIVRAVSEPRKFSGEGKQTAVSVNVAFNFTGKGADGDMEQFSEFYTLKAFSKTADYILSSISKGDKLYIKGSIQPHAYRKDGEVRITREIVPTIVAPTFDSKERRGNSGGNQQSSGGGSSYQRNNNSGNSGSSNSSYGGSDNSSIGNVDNDDNFGNYNDGPDDGFGDYNDNTDGYTGSDLLS